MASLKPLHRKPTMRFSPLIFAGLGAAILITPGPYTGNGYLSHQALVTACHDPNILTLMAKMNQHYAQDQAMAATEAWNMEARKKRLAKLYPDGDVGSCAQAERDRVTAAWVLAEMRVRFLKRGKVVRELHRRGCAEEEENYVTGMKVELWHEFMAAWRGVYVKQLEVRQREGALSWADAVVQVACLAGRRGEL
ncbi:hypothetical protein LTR08_004299 [Meristemomyces frigidus]|nr:hypothetical protein LTR08_004299 [Meristemomyces frigidus]